MFATQGAPTLYQRAFSSYGNTTVAGKSVQNEKVGNGMAKADTPLRIKVGTLRNILGCVFRVFYDMLHLIHAFISQLQVCAAAKRRYSNEAERTPTTGGDLRGPQDLGGRPPPSKTQKSKKQREVAKSLFRVSIVRGRVKHKLQEVD